MVRNTCLVVIDGWGVTDKEDGNAVFHADTPNMDELMTRSSTHRSTTLSASANDVGLPAGQMGNSDVGHLNIGSGQIPFQDIVRIDMALEKNELKDNEVIREIAEKGKRVHLLGLVSDGGVHSHSRHLYGLLSTLQSLSVPPPTVHCFTDGRDTSPHSGRSHLTGLLGEMRRLRYGRIGSVMGRFYAMDRDKRWERIETAFEALVDGSGEEVASYADSHGNAEGDIADNCYYSEKVEKDLEAAIDARYAAEETDEFLKPMIIGDKSSAVIQDDDVLFFFDFRADRMREITHTFGQLEPQHVGKGRVPKNLEIVCMTEYDERYNFPVVIPKLKIHNCLCEWVDAQGHAHLHTAETEKYAHVTFFFNARREEPFSKEERQLVPSPKVATYDLKPEMSMREVGDNVVNGVKSKKFPLVVANLAAPDMVGHTGDFEAAKMSCSVADEVIGKVWAACKESDTVLIVTADHGNCEKMRTEDGKPFTAHTSNPVPFIVADERGVEFKRDGTGILADVAPTVLAAMELPIPEEMAGKPFV